MERLIDRAKRVGLPAILAMAMAACVSQRELSQNKTVTGGSKFVNSALNSDYLVRSGAVLEVGFSKGSRYFVESGGKLRGFAQGVRKSQVFAEKGASVEPRLRSGRLRRQVRIVEVEDASKSFANRDAPWKKAPNFRRYPFYSPLYYGWGWYGHPCWYRGCHYGYPYGRYRHYRYHRHKRAVSARVVRSKFRKKN